MKNWSFAYVIVKQIVRLAFWLSHKRITIIGLSKIPKNKPIIFAPNHQNALMDPLAVLCTNFTQPVWLARADIFKLKATKPILRFLKMLPIYRIRDGKENLGENEKIFSEAIQVLENKKVLALFPEAAHSGKRQMLSHKKAIPRIAFMAEEKNKFKLQLQIVPVGIYYSHYWHFNRELLVQYGEPINVDNYREEYQENPLRANMSLRAVIEQRVGELTINIKSKKHYKNYELIRELIGDEYGKANKKYRNHTRNRLFNDQKLIKSLEKKEQSQPELFAEIHQKLDLLRESLHLLKLNNNHLKESNLQTWKLLGKSIFAFMLLPIIIAGFLLHVVPFLIPRYYIQKRVKDPTFLSTFQFVGGLVIYILLCLFSGIVFFIITKHFGWTLIIIAAIFLIGKLSYAAFQFIKNLEEKYLFFIYAKKNKEAATKLLQQKKEMKEALYELATN